MICPSCASDMTRLEPRRPARRHARHRSVRGLPRDLVRSIRRPADGAGGDAESLRNHQRAVQCADDAAHRRAPLPAMSGTPAPDARHPAPTPFRYWRCDAGHGRLMAYIDFLREKDFVRPLTPQQLDELRQNVQTINCSNCGAAIDLAKDSVCAHCGSAVSMLDLQQMARTIDQLQTAAAGRTPADAAHPAAPPPEPADIDALMQALKAEERASSAPNLIETGLGLLGELLTEKVLAADRGHHAAGSRRRVTTLLLTRSLHRLRDGPAADADPQRRDAGADRAAVVRSSSPRATRRAASKQPSTSLLRLDYPALEIVIVNDRSTDETGAILRAALRPLRPTSATPPPHDRRHQRNCPTAGSARTTRSRSAPTRRPAISFSSPTPTSSSSRARCAGPSTLVEEQHIDHLAVIPDIVVPGRRAERIRRRVWRVFLDVRASLESTRPAEQRPHRRRRVQPDSRRGLSCHRRAPRDRDAARR